MEQKFHEYAGYYFFSCFTANFANKENDLSIFLNIQKDKFTKEEIEILNKIKQEAEDVEYEEV